MYSYSTDLLSIDTEATFGDRILPYGFSLVLLPKPASQPTKGHFYRIKKGDYPLKVAKLAYGEATISNFKIINNSKFNNRFWGPAPFKETKAFPKGRISFNPRFHCDLSEQFKLAKKAPFGHCFAMIWIPPSEGIEPF